MPRLRPSRRNILVLLLTLLGPRWPAPALADEGDATAAVAELLGDADRVRAIGQRYLAQVPEERDLALLRRSLPELAAAGGGDSAAAQHLRERLGRRRTAEFARGDTVLLDGWILSRSEGRLCALAVLL